MAWSIAAVASSSIRIFGLWSMALARQINCRCPGEIEQILSSIFWSSVCVKWLRCALFNESNSWQSSNSPRGSKLSLNVPVNNNGSWGIIVSEDRNSCKQRSLMQIPLMLMWPVSGSSNLRLTKPSTHQIEKLTEKVREQTMTCRLRFVPRFPLWFHVR